MKNLVFLSLSLLVFTGCKNKVETPEVTQQQVVAVQEFVYGERPNAETVLQATQLHDNFKEIQLADTLQTAFKAEVLEVCQAKGCWMRLALPEGEEVMVRFKDYGFFVPKDLAGSEVLIQGRAFISEVSEEDRRHLAEDGGATAAEIDAIQGTTREYGFEASGVQVLEYSGETP
jgi:hypothetical protein